ncbi:hypothetical protein [Trinickia mobilis]|uniref:hypothetical protein n=1 Tax=Trinickia mobilis TaxID=2816356 RepID=UPI001A8EE2F8|nr:hypothetical protein [Trinickia mobilis]
MRPYHEIRRTPLNELSTAEHGVLQLEWAMLKVRETANQIRVKSWMSYRDISYDVGYFNGVRFSIAMALPIGSSDYYEFREVSSRYASEVRFLSSAYLDRRRGSRLS